MGREPWTQLVVVVYDVPDDKRRRKLAKLLESYGTRVQKSAFEARLERGERERLLAQAERLLKPEEDSLILYPIGKDLEAGIVALGAPRPVLEVRTYVIL